MVISNFASNIPLFSVDDALVQGLVLHTEKINFFKKNFIFKQVPITSA